MVTRPLEGSDMATTETLNYQLSKNSCNRELLPWESPRASVTLIPFPAARSGGRKLNVNTTVWQIITGTSFKIRIQLPERQREMKGYWWNRKKPGFWVEVKTVEYRWGSGAVHREYRGSVIEPGPLDRLTTVIDRARPFY